MDFGGIIKAIFGSQDLRWLAVLLLANLVIGVIASIKLQDFRLTRLADWLGSRVLPLMGGYAVAAMIAWANPGFGYVERAAYATVTLALLGYILSNLKDFGIPLPNALAAKRTSAAMGVPGLAGQQSPNLQL